MNIRNILIIFFQLCRASNSNKHDETREKDDRLPRKNRQYISPYEVSQSLTGKERYLTLIFSKFILKI